MVLLFNWLLSVAKTRFGWTIIWILSHIYSYNLLHLIKTATYLVRPKTYGSMIASFYCVRFYKYHVVNRRPTVQWSTSNLLSYNNGHNTWPILEDIFPLLALNPQSQIFMHVAIWFGYFYKSAVHVVIKPLVLVIEQLICVCIVLWVISAT